MLGWFGHEPVPLLFSSFAVLVCLVYVHLPFMVLPLYANLEKHDRALLDAAQDLGAGAWQRFWRITFPLSLPGVYAGAALVFIPALGIFAIPDILGGPDDSLIGNVIKQQFLETRDWPFGSVLSIVLTVAALVLAGAAAWIGRAQPGDAFAARSRLVRRRPIGLWAAALAGYAFLYVPLLIVIVYSFNDSRLNAEWVGFTFDWYDKLFHNQDMLLAAGNSLLIGLTASAVSTVLGTMAGLAMYRYRNAAAVDPRARADRHSRDPDGRLAADLLRAAQPHAGTGLGGARPHRVLHRLRRHRRALAAGRNGREPDRGRARLRRIAAGTPFATSRCRLSCRA